MSEPNETLKVLAILHYVLGGFTALFACIPFLHVIVGTLILLGGEVENSGATWVGLFFVLFPGFLILVGWTLAGLLILAGRNLGTHRRKSFCQVVAAIECLMIPFGTALGITTLILISQPENSDAFEN